ncbi:sphingosine hydroxylase [Lenzites betulinus]|nr:sphingosine hydroxylase [Lenzites betulinus]
MNTTSAAPAFLDQQQLHYLSTNSPIYYSPKASLVDGVPDHIFALAAPVIAYWLLSGFFHSLDISGWKWLEKYRIHESAEIKSGNLATRGEVLVQVILQQVIQTGMGLIWLTPAAAGDSVDHLANMLKLAGPMSSFIERILGQELSYHLLATRGAIGIYTLYWWAIPLVRLFIGIFLIDSWQYFLHRALHMNSYLYKKIHAQHHRLYVPYAYGTLYNHPLEGFLMDTLGSLIAERAAGLTPREATFLFVIAILKAVDIHCGYNFPWDPLQLVSANTANYHDIHHQVSALRDAATKPCSLGRRARACCSY